MSSSFKMIDIGEKPITKRKAIASGYINLTKSVLEKIIAKTVPKGDVLMLAEIAAISAAKRTSDILPLCHPLAIEKISVGNELDLENLRIKISCEVSTHSKTGVEMEALAATTAALLCIYDLTKSLDKASIISEIKLDYKEGGKSGPWKSSGLRQDKKNKKLENKKAAVITVSDSCYKLEAEDLSGKLLKSYLEDNSAEVLAYSVVPDELSKIQDTLKNFLIKELDLILITGGTGLGPRDITPEALSSFWTKKLPGFGERFRLQGQISTRYSWLSRAEAGLIGKTFVASLPGSLSAVKDALIVLDGEVEHLLSIIKGGRH